jgi:hypothetical protein
MASLFRHTSLTKGVSFDKGSQRWVGRFTLNGQKHYVGKFKDEADAAVAVNRARINVVNSYSLRSEVKDILEEERSEIERNAPLMSPVQEWTSLTLRQLKDFAEKHGITPDDVIGDKRFKQNWIDVLVTRDVRPMTAKEGEINSAIDEINGLITYLNQDEKDDRDYTDEAVLDLPEQEWSPCVIIDPSEPSYFWCHAGFLYTLYPTEGYTVWRYDTNVSGHYKPIGVWNGPKMDKNEDPAELTWEISVDRVAGTYCKMSRSGLDQPEEGEILENWHEDAVFSSPLSENRNRSFPEGKSARTR